MYSTAIKITSGTQPTHNSPTVLLSFSRRSADLHQTGTQRGRLHLMNTESAISRLPAPATSAPPPHIGRPNYQSHDRPLESAAVAAAGGSAAGARGDPVCPKTRRPGPGSCVGNAAAVTAAAGAGPVGRPISAVVYFMVGRFPQQTAP